MRSIISSAAQKVLFTYPVPGTYHAGINFCDVMTLIDTTSDNQRTTSRTIMIENKNLKSASNKAMPF